MSSSGSRLFLAKITVSVTVRILLTFCVVTCWHIGNLSKVGNVPDASCAVIS